MKRTATAEEKRHMSRVQALGCVVCSVYYGYDDTPAEIHHVRFRHGWGRSGHDKVIPLCREHHRGDTGVHNMGRAQFERMYGKSEIEFLDIVIANLGI